VQELFQCDSELWVRTSHYLQDSHQEGELAYISAFILALAFGNAPPSALDLISLSFERVHEAAKQQTLKENAWSILEPYVPELWWGKNWDRCERLKRALVSAFVRHGWPAWELKHRIRDFHLIQEILDSAGKVEGGQAYFKNLE
jgi:hypothetical protein